LITTANRWLLWHRPCDRPAVLLPRRQDRLRRRQPSQIHPTVKCDIRQTDASSYPSVLALFQHAFSLHSRIDCAIANAGLIERGVWFPPAASTSLEEATTELDTRILDVNLKGVLFFSRVALVYLVHSPITSTTANGHGVPPDKSLDLLASVAGIKESPGFWVYGASKHGVVGLMRCLRVTLPKTHPGVRVNAIFPSMVDTPIVAMVKEQWIAAGNPVNTPADIAEVIAGLCVCGPGRGGAVRYDKTPPGKLGAGQMDWASLPGGVHGRAMYVCGGEAWDVEEGLDRTSWQWFGEEQTASWAGATDVVDQA
jgi:NAD(P)-dependent dehydrogenase (short-subunit alcohol dehydrogenase family)